MRPRGCGEPGCRKILGSWSTEDTLEPSPALRAVELGGVQCSLHLELGDLQGLPEPLKLSLPRAYQPGAFLHSLHTSLSLCQAKGTLNLKVKE